MAQVQFKIWRGSNDGGELEEYATDITEGMVVLDAIHQIQAESGQRSGRTLELQGGQVRLVLGGGQRQAQAADVHDADAAIYRWTEGVTVEPIKAFPIIKDLVTDVSWNYRVKQKHQALQAA